MTTRTSTTADLTIHSTGQRPGIKVRTYDDTPGEHDAFACLDIGFAGNLSVRILVDDPVEIAQLGQAIIDAAREAMRPTDDDHACYEPCDYCGSGEFPS